MIVIDTCVSAEQQLGRFRISRQAQIGTSTGGPLCALAYDQSPHFDMLRSTCTRSIRHVIAGRSVLSSSSSRASFWSGASTTATGAAATATASHVPFNAIPHIDPSFIPFILALLLANADQEDEATSGHGSNTSQQPPWQVTNTSKGQGAFADRDIHRGQCSPENPVSRSFL